MKRFRVVWTQIPYAYNRPHVLFVEADTAEDAVELAKRHIEETLGLPRREFKVEAAEDSYVAPAGRILEG